MHGFDKRHRVRLAEPRHIVRMHHRGAAVEPVDLAAHHHRFIDRQGLFQPVALDAEEGERKLPGLVMQENTVRLARFTRWRRLVAVDAAGDGYDEALRRMGDARLVAPIDDRVREMEDEVDDPAVLDALLPEQAREEIAEFRADARKRGEGSEERIKQCGSHGGQNRRTRTLWQG